MSLAIEAKGLEKRVSNGSNWLNILKGVDLSIANGESVAILGRSGSGKTTLLSLLAGLDDSSAGEIRLSGHSLAGLNEEQRARLRAGRVGFVFQAFQLLESFTALENVRLSAELAGLPQPAERALAALSSVDLAERTNHYPRQLSGGEKQRVALARAFVGEPDILFADEPTGNLDAGTGSHISKLLFEMNEQRNTTLVLVTHDVELARRCQRQLHLVDGQLEPA